jgi:hypothetical protein
MHDALADRRSSLELLNGEPTLRLPGWVKVVHFTRHYFRWTEQTHIHCIFAFIRSRCHLQGSYDIPSVQEMLWHPRRTGMKTTLICAQILNRDLTGLKEGTSDAHTWHFIDLNLIHRDCYLRGTAPRRSSAPVRGGSSFRHLVAELQVK